MVKNISRFWIKLKETIILAGVKKNYFLLAVLFLLLLPFISFAEGFVPCGGAGEDTCQACHFAIMLNTLVKWLIGMLSVLMAVIFVVAGIKLVTSGGNTSARESAKSMITNGIVGFVVVLSAWLLVDTILKMLTNSEFGTWNKIECVAQPKASILRIDHPVADASRGIAVGNAGDVNVDGLAVPNSLDDKIAEEGEKQGLSEDQIRNMQALMRVESGGCSNPAVKSPVGAVGCMQIMPTTAMQYDKTLKSEADAKAKLEDPNYNIELGAKIYADLYKNYGNQPDKIFAAYNGGVGSNKESSDCPGQMRWQCVWDSPGCYGTTNVDCVPNTGYQETRDYVSKVNAVSEKLKETRDSEAKAKASSELKGI